MAQISTAYHRNVNPNIKVTLTTNHPVVSHR